MQTQALSLLRNALPNIHTYYSYNNDEEVHSKWIYSVGLSTVRKYVNFDFSKLRSLQVVFLLFIFLLMRLSLLFVSLRTLSPGFNGLRVFPHLLLHGQKMAVNPLIYLCSTPRVCVRDVGLYSPLIREVLPIHKDI